MKEHDETNHLLSTKANKERLLEDVFNDEKRQGVKELIDAQKQETNKMDKLYRKVGSRYKEVRQDLSLDQELVLTAAFRYALGRSTYIVSSVCAELVRLESVMGEGQKRFMSKEIQEYQEKHGKAGWDMDNDEWNYVKWLFDPSRRVILEAKYHGTDNWMEAEAVSGDDDIYYSLEGMTKYFHTTRNIRNK